MPSRDAGQLVLWPHYFDRELSRGQGRRVAKDLAMDKPRVHDVAKAARSLGLKVTVLEDARHPAHWYEPKNGCVLVDKADEPKDAILQQVAKRL